MIIKLRPQALSRLRNVAVLDETWVVFLQRHLTDAEWRIYLIILSIPRRSTYSPSIMTVLTSAAGRADGCGAFKFTQNAPISSERPGGYDALSRETEIWSAIALFMYSLPRFVAKPC